MSLTKEQFEQLVGRLELQARADPAAYGRKVLLLALLGNAYLGLVLLLLAAVFAGLLASIFVLKTLAIELAILVGVLIWAVVKALWIRQDAPEGIEVTRDMAPALFAQIDEQCGRLRAARVHRVLMTGHFNASIVQLPRLGVFGWPRNTLMIGLPLLSALSVDEWRAVLAHELGHISRGHGRVSNWVYRQRLRWRRLDELIATRHGVAGFLFRPFMRWYAPYFLAYSLPLARANEYEADAASARLATKRVTAAALTRVQVAGHFLQNEFWPLVYGKAGEQPQPGFMPYRGMAQAIAGRIPQERADAWIAEAMKEKTGIADTHPALKDRLGALGEAPRLAPADGPRAAQELLGSFGESLADLLDRHWRDRVLLQRRDPAG